MLEHKYGEKRRREGDKGRKREGREDCHIDLVLLPAMAGGGTGRRVTQKTGAPCEEGEDRAAVKLAQPHKGETTRALCVHIHVRSLAIEAVGLKWRYSRQYGVHAQI